MTIDQRTITGEAVVTNLPSGREVGIQTDANLSVFFRNPVTGAYDAANAITVPGNIIFCPVGQAKITTTTTANINITIFQ